MARWEERLKGSKQRLHVMRMERAQWHAMVQAADTQHHGEEKTEALRLYQGALVDSGFHFNIHFHEVSAVLRQILYRECSYQQ